MAEVYWTGNAAAIAQVTTLTVGGTIEADDVFIVTIGDKAISVVAGSTVAATVATAIFDAIQDAIATGNYPEFAEISWDNDTSAVVTATGPSGVPFTVTPTTTETGGGAADDQTFSGSTTTAASGPNFASVAANWSDGAVPDGSDTAIFADSSVDCLYGLDTAFPIASVTMTGFRVDASFTGRIGLPLINDNGYEEYRPRYLQVGLDNDLTVPIGWGPGPGSTRLYLNFETADNTLVKVFSTGQPEDADDEALRILVNDAGVVLEIAKGSVGLAREPGQTSTAATVRIEFVDNQEGDVTFRAGSGCTLATLVANGGEILTDCALTTVTLLAGTWTHTGGAVTTIVNTAGTMVDQSTGTIGSYTGRSGSVYDHRSDFRRKTYSAVDLYEGATWLDPNPATIASSLNNVYTAGIDFNQCEPNQVTWQVGPNRRVTIGDTA